MILSSEISTLPKQLQNLESESFEQGLNSVFGRLNYSFKDRYLFTFTARYDESTKFGPNNRGGFFPSAAIAWNMHNETFLKDHKIISQLKLRASLGRTGSDNLPAFAYLALFQSLDNGDSFYNGQNGIAVPSIPNNDIQWETTDQLDIGLEFELWGGRAYGEITYFEKKTSDIILFVPLPAETGATSFNNNIADVTNTGWEILIGGNILNKQDFTWNSSLNLSFIKNNVDALNGGATSAFGSAGIIEGHPIGVINGYDVLRIAQTQEEINTLNDGAPDGNYFSGLSQPGDYIFRDVDGDGEITRDDRVPIGDINPDYFGGWNNTLTYKNLDFTFNLQFIQGNRREWARATNLSFANYNANLTTLVFDTWTPENTGANFARLGSGTHGFVPTSRSVVDGSYLRLRSASIGYTLPKAWLEPLKIANAKLIITGNNLFTITDYPGPDPENVDQQRGGSSIDLRSDGGFAYPNARTFTFGFILNL